MLAALPVVAVLCLLTVLTVAALPCLPAFRPLDDGRNMFSIPARIVSLSGQHRTGSHCIDWRLGSTQTHQAD